MNHAVQRENRLHHRRERERACRASENPEQREESLQKRRIRDRTRHAAQIAERRGADLQQRGEDLPTRLLRREKPGCGKRLLPTMRDWLLRLLRRERPGYRVLVRHRHQLVMQAQLPLFQQSSVRTKMLKFHAHHMATLDALRCTCS